MVSIIIPVYNTEEYLNKCLDSVLNQTYTNLEIWLIDDGSKDASAAICDEYGAKDERIIVVHKENEGQAVARNVALDRCKGDYILFVDSDDRIEQNCVQRSVEEAMAESADLVVFGFAVETGLKLDRITHERYTLDSAALLKSYLTERHVSTVMWNKFYSRGLFSGVRFPKLRANEDAYVLPGIISKTKKAVVIPDCLYYQFSRIGSTERSPFSEKKLALLQASDEMCRVAAEFGPDMNYYAELKRARETKSLLDRIGEDGVYAEHRDTYDNLRTRLKTEISDIRKNYPEFIKNENELTEMENAALNMRRHLIKTRIDGVVASLKGTVKCCLVRFKR